MTTLTLDKKVPNFSFLATNDTQMDLADLKGQNIVLYFYPKDNTPGCTMESQDFRDAYPQFSKLNTCIFGISRDSLSSHEKFKAKHDFPFELISDSDESVCDIFDVVKMKSMFGKAYRGIVRSTFLIDANGILRQEWRKVSVKNHVAEVLQAVKKLG